MRKDVDVIILFNHRLRGDKMKKVMGLCYSSIVTLDKWEN